MSLLNKIQTFSNDRLSMMAWARSSSMNGRSVMMIRRCPLSDPSIAKSSSRLYHTFAGTPTHVERSFPSYIRSKHFYSTKLFSSSSDNHGGMDSKENEEEINHSPTVSDEANDCIKSCNDENDEEILSTTKKWIQNVVIGLNFCPFAERSMTKKQLFYELVRGDDVEEIVSSVVYHSLRRQDNAGTTVVICPDLYPMDFQGGYLDALDMIQNILSDGNLNQDIQVRIYSSSHLDLQEPLTQSFFQRLPHFIRYLNSKRQKMRMILKISRIGEFLNIDKRVKTLKTFT